MSNSIDPNLHALLNKAGQKVSGTDKDNNASRSADAAGAARPATADKVVLTEESRLLGSIEKTIAAMPAIDQARVDAVKADIENGNYEIDLDNLAELLMQSDLQLG